MVARLWKGAVRQHDGDAYAEYAPVLVRRSSRADVPSLERLAALRGTTKVHDGVYLVAEVRNELVAAVALAGRAPTLQDPELSDDDLLELLQRWARNLRRNSARTGARRSLARSVR
jgi:hypothetical protein